MRSNSMTDYSDRGFLVFVSVSPAECRDGALRKVLTNTFFALFLTHPDLSERCQRGLKNQIQFNLAFKRE